MGIGWGSLCAGAVGGFGYGYIDAKANHSNTPLGDACLGGLKGMASGFVGAIASVAMPYGDSWGAGALIGGTASNVTSQLLSHDWKSDESFKLNWKSTLFSAGLSWGI